MRFQAATAAVLASAMVVAGLGRASAAEARIQFPTVDKAHADQKILDEFTEFYWQIEDALEKEDVAHIMEFYAEDYLHHGVTKRQLKFMWLEVFGDFKDLYSVHVFTKVSVHGDDAILVCTGGLFGIPNTGGDYTTIDQWATLPHWLTKVDGRWKMVGGATRASSRKGGGRLGLHPFF